MNILNISGQWHMLQGRMKQKWAKLTEDDLTYLDGKKEELVGRIQQRAAEGDKSEECEETDTCGCCKCVTRTSATEPTQPSTETSV